MRSCAAEYEAYTRNALVQLRRVREGTQLEEDHMRNRQMVVRWLMAHTKAIEVRRRDGKTYYVMTDPEAFSEGVGSCSPRSSASRRKATTTAAKSSSRPSASTSIRAPRRGRGARRRAEPALLYRLRHAELEVVTDAGGVTDVTISYPQDLTSQMLEYSGKSTEEPAVSHRP